MTLSISSAVAPLLVVSCAWFGGLTSTESVGWYRKCFGGWQLANWQIND